MGLKLRELKEETMKVVFGNKVVDPTALQPGHHIYAYRFRTYGIFFYTHHGIYEGGGEVIHFSRSEPIFQFSKASYHHHHRRYQCTHIRDREGEVLHHDGVTKTCLDCFRRDGTVLRNVHLYGYGVHWLRFFLRVRGSCTTTAAATKTPTQVVEVARELLYKKRFFGTYSHTRRNCEHFATFCTTGDPISEQSNFWAPWTTFSRNTTTIAIHSTNIKTVS